MDCRYCVVDGIQPIGIAKFTTKIKIGLEDVTVGICGPCVSRRKIESTQISPISTTIPRPTSDQDEIEEEQHPKSNKKPSTWDAFIDRCLKLQIGQAAEFRSLIQNRELWREQLRDVLRKNPATTNLKWMVEPSGVSHVKVTRLPNQMTEKTPTKIKSTPKEKPVSTKAQENKIVGENKVLCKCGCGQLTMQYNGYVWGHKNKNLQEVIPPAPPAPESPTSLRVSVVERTHKEMTVEENHDSELAQSVQALRVQIETISKRIEGPVFDFWLEPELMSRDIRDEGFAWLWGAKVPVTIIDAIWYGLADQAKADLLSAIAVARYKERPPQKS